MFKAMFDKILRVCNFKLIRDLLLVQLGCTLVLVHLLFLRFLVELLLLR